MTKPKLLLPVLVLALFVISPTSAGAKLVFTRGEVPNSAVFAAEDDGSQARKVATGTNPYLLPSGSAVVFLTQGGQGKQLMQMADLDGPERPILLRNWREPELFAVSWDATRILALRGPEIGKRELVLIHVPTGKLRPIARGYFSGFSLSHNGREFVYARSGKDEYPPRSDVFRASSAGGKSVQITRDHRSSSPLWGPNEEIVFVKTVAGKQRRYGPKNELFLMSPQGKGVKRLTNTKVPPLLQGLFPTDWSEDGTRLLAEFQGQDTSYAATVNPKTGAQRPVAEAGENGFVGTALSADGKFVLGFTGGFDPSGGHKVVTVPYGGGKPKVLAKNAFEPDWSL